MLEYVFPKGLMDSVKVEVPKGSSVRLRAAQAREA